MHLSLLLGEKFESPLLIYGIHKLPSFFFFDVNYTFVKLVLVKVTQGQYRFCTAAICMLHGRNNENVLH